VAAGVAAGVAAAVAVAVAAVAAVVAVRAGDAEDNGKETSRMNSEIRKTIAIAAEDDRGLDGEVSHHFGRCLSYVIAVVEGGQVVSTRVQMNPHYANHQPGQMPVYIRSLGADVILAGGMGPKAVTMFQQFGMEVATGAVGNVGRVLDAYLAGEVKGTVPCSHDHPDSCGNHGDDEPGVD
jgi:predicted Fe-Mo cluster-binding NifX family protein